jgi:repressor LexA
MAHRARALEIVKLPDVIIARDKAAEKALEKAEKPARFAPRLIDGDRPVKPRGAMPIESVAAVELPVMGRIAAGVPIEAISEVSHNVTVPQSMLGAGEHYALEVHGDSMIDAGINDGDIVVIRETSTAETGDIVVALVMEQEATLKRFRRQNGMIALEAANPAYETRVYRADQVRVQGKLVGLIRTY